VGDKYPSLEEKAAALAYHLAKLQACVKGNKRVALILTTAFLRLNRRRFAPAVAATTEPAERIWELATTTEAEDVVIASTAQWFRDSTVAL
jgi:prophage maintenance system killer protein